MAELCTLIIMDGYGLSEDNEYNAVKKAYTPNLDRYFKEYPNTRLRCSGLAVGLPEGQMGNSEVGHMNIGAGRVVYQELTRISKEIEDGGFFNNPVLKGAMDNARVNNSKLHIMGLVSPGGVHSHTEHLYALLRMAKDNGIEKVYIHAFLDGRDTPPQSASEYIEDLEQKIKEIGVGEIATVSGRYYAMDRDKRWERVKKAYDALVMGIGRVSYDPIMAVKTSYEEGVNDEFVVPTVIKRNNEITATIDKNDSVIFFNFRADRARQLSHVLTDEEFNGFDREKGYFSTYYVTMTQYDDTLKNVHVAYPPEVYINTLGEYVSKLGLNQLRIAETEKYAHVTFFFSGGVEEPYKGEDRVLIPSPKVATYDLKPEMSAYEVTDEVIRRIDSGIYNLIVLNYANCDMVGHTGIFDAAEKAVETVDKCVGKVVDKVLSKGGKAIITADHGNAEKMWDEETNAPHTAHTSNPVPFIVIGEDDIELKNDGRLCDIAPTILDIMGKPIPQEMTGQDLIIRKER
ncbi:MAG: 2,3-bisphosphoglycerate-independent phosphoglycerate mutase [Thermoanaerobacteraceae bacterium]|nr:2,3-bisphosphoglycerate-independent phosphoglycerate mutase [Thermoanaerobacteraceae bacterium]